MYVHAGPPPPHNNIHLPTLPRGGIPLIGYLSLLSLSCLCLNHYPMHVSPRGGP